MWSGVVIALARRCQGRRALLGGRSVRDPLQLVWAGGQVDGDDAATADPQAQRWALRPAAHHPLLEAVDLHGAHDFRHTFSTWLEDAGMPARVIDELMGHQASGRAGRHPGSAIGAHYRHTTPEMAARVATAVEKRLVVVLATAEAALDQQPW